MAEETVNKRADKAIAGQVNDNKTAFKDRETDAFEGASEQEANAPKGKTLLKRIWRHKYILGSLVIFLVATVWAGTRSGSELWNIVKKKEQIIQLSDIEMEDLSEEILQPLFIPLGKDAAEGMMRIDFSVIWDGLASVRYDKMHLLIRDRLFRDISSAVVEDKDAEKKRELLKNKMGSILREMLGMNNLVIKIKEINYF